MCRSVNPVPIEMLAKDKSRIAAQLIDFDIVK
jgi:hypothetical protein